jgi:hypothetical protein
LLFRCFPRKALSLVIEHASRLDIGTYSPLLLEELAALSGETGVFRTIGKIHGRRNKGGHRNCLERGDDILPSAEISNLGQPNIPRLGKESCRFAATVPSKCGQFGEAPLAAAKIITEAAEFLGLADEVVVHGPKEVGQSVLERLKPMCMSPWVFLWRVEQLRLPRDFVLRLQTQVQRMSQGRDQWGPGLSRLRLMEVVTNPGPAAQQRYETLRIRRLPQRSRLWNIDLASHINEARFAGARSVTWTLSGNECLSLAYLKPKAEPSNRAADDSFGDHAFRAPEAVVHDLDKGGFARLRRARNYADPSGT